MDISSLGPWQSLLDTDAFAPLFDRAAQAYETQTVYPPEAQLFTAFSLTPPEAVM